MTDLEFGTYLESMLPGYAEEHARAGSMPDEGALQRARAQVTALVPDGVHTPDQYICVIEEEASGTAVGILWFAKRDQGANPTAFLYDIQIFEPFRRHGYARQAFRVLEDRVRELGLSTISLHVFGSNSAARELYRKLGFQETHVMMNKTVLAQEAGGH